MNYDLKCHFNAETGPIVLALSKFNLYQIIGYPEYVLFQSSEKYMIKDNSVPFISGACQSI